VRALLALSLFASALAVLGQPEPSRVRPEAPAPLADSSVALLGSAGQAEAVDPEKALTLARAARAVARTLREELRADLMLASLERQRGDYPGALAQARSGRERAAAAGERALEAEFLLVLARTQWSRSELPAALQSFQALLALAEGLGDPQMLARAHNGFGTTQAVAGQWERAVQHYETARKFATQSGDRAALADVLNNLGNFHLSRTRDYARARALHEDALALHEQLGDRRGLADSHLNLGTIASATADYPEAIRRFELAREIHAALGVKRNLANALRSLGTALRKSGRPHDALVRLHESEALATELGSPAVLGPIFRELAATHETLGDWRAAFVAERRHAAANEAVLSERTRERIVTLNERADAERHRREVDLLRREQAMQQGELAQTRWQHGALLAVVACGVVAVVALISRQRLKLAAERRVLEETRTAQVAAEAADALKTRLVSIASHDLRAPLSSIATGAAVIACDPQVPAAVATCATLMQREAQRLGALIRDLLEVSAVEMRRLDFHFSPVAVAPLVSDAVAAAQPRAVEKGQTLVADLAAAGAAHTRADPARLRQALDNLIDNALKFTPPGGGVRVISRQESDLVEVAVQDEGPGLSPEDFAQLFQPFHRLSAVPTGGESSSGLGLYIAREIIAAHGGQIVVDSTPGEGATFRVLLPAAAES
jgi:signal transduction histidine kinase/tetratricopeptide (TPR) repeat protein